MKTSTSLLILAVLCALGMSFWAGGKYAVKRYTGEADTVYVEKWIRDSIPVVKDSIVYRTKIVSLPVHDTTSVHDTTLVVDSVLVEVPIVDKFYEGENYRATVRGFQPELVDIWVKQKETTITVPYRKRWSVTAGPQIGVGFTPGGFQPYLGVGATFGYSF